MLPWQWISATVSYWRWSTSKNRSTIICRRRCLRRFNAFLSWEHCNLCPNAFYTMLIMPFELIIRDHRIVVAEICFSFMKTSMFVRGYCKVDASTWAWRWLATQFEWWRWWILNIERKDVNTFILQKLYQTIFYCPMLLFYYRTYPKNCRVPSWARIFIIRRKFMTIGW